MSILFSQVYDDNMPIHADYLEGTSKCPVYQLGYFHGGEIPGTCEIITVGSLQLKIREWINKQMRLYISTTEGCPIRDIYITSFSLQSVKIDIGPLQTPFGSFGDNGVVEATLITLITEQVL